jgi:hypothetical protein
MPTGWKAKNRGKLTPNGWVIGTEVVVNHSPRRSLIAPEAGFPICDQRLRVKNEDAPPSWRKFFPRGAFLALDSPLAREGPTTGPRVSAWVRQRQDRPELAQKKGAQRPSRSRLKRFPFLGLTVC